MAPALRVDGLRVDGDRGRVILAVDALAIAPGERVAVRGPSGAGKTTLLYALGGLIRPQAGRICWGERDIARLSNAGRTAFRREEVGIIFQDFLLFEELSPLQNAAIARAYTARSKRRHLGEEAEALLQHLGIANHARRRVDTFSGGERQRVSIARALAGDPGIILADEPTASLDRATADRLIDDLVSIAGERGKTLIAVTHDPALQGRMDRIIEIVDGRLHADSAGRAAPEVAVRA